MIPPRHHLALALCTLIALPLAATALEPTPSTGLGPFFPADESTESDPDLTRVAGRDDAPEGEIILVEGRVLSTSGEALEGTEIVIWQTDVRGKYKHPREVRRTRDGEEIPEDPAFQYWGKTATGAGGHYRFRTILPGAYGGRVRHIHFRIRGKGHPTLGTELHFRGDPHGGDFVTSEGEHDRLAVPLEPVPGEPGVQRATFDVVLL
jgi:protocatechuate 3,4-dioxygenase, beta subunit